MAQTVKVRLRKPPRVFTFVCRDIPLGRNDTCVVRTDRGLEYGVCVMPPEEASPDEEERLKMTVVRRASHHDDTTYKQIQIDEDRAKDVCKEKIGERELPMKLVECEYSFDRKKIIFYFTADERVDFRELVRDLAREFKARIELRHIQVRDEAKLVGGLGTCGRELCCTTWMREFIPISMKMAKRQNLSLNPSKISGQCGRLLCCLSYENDQYQRARKKAKQEPQADLGALREEMESNPEAAVDTLKDSTLADVFDENGEPEAEESVAAEGGPIESDATDAGASPAKDESAGGGGPSGRSRPRGKGRRRRRGKRPGGKGSS